MTRGWGGPPRMRAAIAGMVLLAPLLATFGGTGSASGAAAVDGTAPGAPRYERLTRYGTTNLSQMASSPAPPARALAVDDGLQVQSSPEVDTRDKAGVAQPEPAPPASPIRGGGGQGFDALDHTDQRLADNANQPNLEPPDQGLCATGGQVMEMVNDALAVYTDAGAVVVPTVALNPFFGLPSSVDRLSSEPSFGPFISDPKCYYDPPLRRWFLTVLEIDLNPRTAAFRPRSALLIAVSQTTDPTGSYALFRLDLTDDGASGSFAHNCPCFGDQPLIGADANGFYVTTNEFSLPDFASNGSQVYAMSKPGLAAAATAATATGAPMPTVVHFDAGTAGGEQAFSLQPAVTPPGGTYGDNVEYLLSSLSRKLVQDRLVVWAVLNTAGLADERPAVSLSRRLVDSEPYTLPPNVDQKPGPHPLGRRLGEPLNQISSNDQRMQQVVYVKGRLFGALTTGVAGDRAGLAWFVMRPSVTTSGVDGTVEHQGYVAVDTDSVMYPAVGVTQSGRGVIGFSLAGPHHFPSTAYVDIDLTGAHGPVRILGVGAAPEDGATCYHALVGDEADFGCRWGDYSAAVAVGDTVLTASEYITPRPRLVGENWGTFIGRIPT